MTNKTITEQQWKALKSETFSTIMAILQTVDVLIKHTKEPAYAKDNTPTMCAGLYSHAIEEYGKLIYLKNLLPVNGKVEIDYDDRFKEHKFKFPLALKNLPKACKILHKGHFGAHFGGHYDIDTIADWYMRLNIFNTNFDNNGNVVKYPTIDLGELQKAVFEFRNELYRIKL